MEGVDYAFTKPPVSALVAAGKRFAVRYGGAGTADKWLRPSEMDALTRAGIAVVSNVEGTADGMNRGYNVGYAWAQAADEHFRVCGMPPTRPIYLSADWDVQPHQWGNVRAALQGAADAIGPGRVGLYGGRRVIEWAQRDRAAQWYWQTYAWSGNPTVWVGGTHIQQYRNGVPLGGATVDLNRSMTVDFGQWGVGMDLSDKLRAPYPHAGDTVEGALSFTWDNSERTHDGVVALAKTVAHIKTTVDALPATAGLIRPEDFPLLAEALRPVLTEVLGDLLSRLDLTVRPRV